MKNKEHMAENLSSEPDREPEHTHANPNVMLLMNPWPNE